MADTGEGLQSYEELQTNLEEYQRQLQQVEQLLLDDPENDELQEMYQSLEEVMQLTRDLLKDAKQQHDAGSLIPASATAPEPALAAAAAAAVVAPPAGALPALAASQIAVPAALILPEMMPASVAEQIKRAQQRAALLGQGEPANAVGAECYAVYSADGQYYPAVVDSVLADGRFVVLFEGYGNREEVSRLQVRPRQEGDDGYKAVPAPKRKRVEEEVTVTEIPTWLEIKPGDPEKVVLRKKKLLKSYKSKIRFQNMDMAQKGKQQNWKSFLKGKGAKGKAGFFTGRKKESMFAVPEGGKVGVVGSGKGMTDFKKQKRHEFALAEEAG